MPHRIDKVTLEKAKLAGVRQQLLDVTGATDLQMSGDGGRLLFKKAERKPPTP